MTESSASTRSDTTARDAGAVAVIVAILAPVLFGICAFAVDVARWYVEGARMQKAADAAALAAVPYLPQDRPGAFAKAVEFAALNGFTATTPTVTVTPDQTGLPSSQIRVTITSTVSNAFGSILGTPKTTVSRTAVADYNAKEKLGSPCNTFGNEPDALTGSAASNLAPCATKNPQYWANIVGPQTFKERGDQYMARSCLGVETGCASASRGARNNDFKTEGYFFLIDVKPSLVNTLLSLQLYDPAFVATESKCDSLSGLTGLSDTMNPGAAPAADRYRASATPLSGGRPTYCAGDLWNSTRSANGDGSEVPTVTSFGLRAPTNSEDPLKAPPVTDCAPKQYQGYDTPTSNQLRQTSAQYNSELASVFHKWTTMCTFMPKTAGFHYLQVRTNVPFGDASKVFSQSGDDTSVRGDGSNRFAIRVSGSNGSAVSVSGLDRMPLYFNSPSTQATFNLIKVKSAAKGQTLTVQFYDAGDGESNGKIRILPPLNAKHSPSGVPVALTTLTGCVGKDRASGSMQVSPNNCTVTGINGDDALRPRWQGSLATVEVKIPDTYSCVDTDDAECWFRIFVDFPDNGVADATTWTASVSGDPVRLTQ